METSGLQPAAPHLPEREQQGVLGYIEALRHRRNSQWRAG